MTKLFLGFMCAAILGVYTVNGNDVVVAQDVVVQNASVEPETLTLKPEIKSSSEPVVMAEAKSDLIQLQELERVKRPAILQAVLLNAFDVDSKVEGDVAKFVKLSAQEQLNVVASWTIDEWTNKKNNKTSVTEEFVKTVVEFHDTVNDLIAECMTIEDSVAVECGCCNDLIAECMTIEDSVAVECGCCGYTGASDTKDFVEHALSNHVEFKILKGKDVLSGICRLSDDCAFKAEQSLSENRNIIQEFRNHIEKNHMPTILVTRDGLNLENQPALLKSVIKDEALIKKIEAIDFIENEFKAERADFLLSYTQCIASAKVVSSVLVDKFNSLSDAKKLLTVAGWLSYQWQFESCE
jgi:hypothetical protein